MQCFLHRWNTFAIGHNATAHAVISPTLKRHANQTPRYLSHKGLRLSGQNVAAQTTTSRRSSARPSRSRSAREADVIDEVAPREHRLKSLSTSKSKAQLDDAEPEYEKQQWQVQKAALKAKLGDRTWNPQKRLSPDTIEGIRAMHNSDPGRFTTPVLAENFKVSPEAIRRILKSKWQPTAEVQEKRRERWERRGERVWSSLAEIGVKPPKPWRVRGVGKAEPGDIPLWKGTSGGRGHRSGGGKGPTDATTVRRGLIAEKSSSTTSVASAGIASISTRIL